MMGARGSRSGRLVIEAESLVRDLLVDDTDRLAHVLTVVRQATTVASTVDAVDRDILIAAAWLHDIGYIPALLSSGFHPLDGARYLEHHDWPGEVCDLVAHHSGARFTAELCGFRDELRHFGFTENAISDALTVADQTSGPRGQLMTVDERLREMLERQGPESPNARAHTRRANYIRGAMTRVDERSARHRGPQRRPTGIPTSVCSLA